MKPYFQDEAVTIYHGDCRDVLPSLPLVDLVLTSPPYNKGIADDGRELPPEQRVGHYAKDARMDGGRGGAGAWKAAALADGYGEYGDALPYVEYEAFQHGVLQMCWNQLSDIGAIYYNHKPRIIGTELWLPLALNPGLPLRQIVIWNRGSGFNWSPTYYTPTHEWVLIFAKSAFRIRPGTDRFDVWTIPPETGTEHPAPFPIAFARRAVETAGGGGHVLDPFMGSGTTLRAAKDLGRKAIGIEIEERYCEIAAKRMAQAVLL